MAHLRQKKVELNGIDSRWEGCYVLVSTKGFMAVQELARKFGKLQYGIEKLDIKSKKLKRRIEEESDYDKSEELFLELDRMHDESDRLSAEMLDFMIKNAKESFIAGTIFDAEKNASREMSAQDIDILDTEILTKLTNAILGSIEKKD